MMDMGRHQRVSRGRGEKGMYKGALLGLGHYRYSGDCRDARGTRWRPLRAGGGARDPAAAAGTTVVASAHCHPRVCSLVAALLRARRFHSRISTMDGGTRHRRITLRSNRSSSQHGNDDDNDNDDDNGIEINDIHSSRCEESSSSILFSR